MGLFGKKETVRAVVPEGFRIAGAFANQGAFKAHLPGRVWVEHGRAAATSACEVTLRAEPRNRYDSRAVAVRLGMVTLGHVPRGHLDWAHAELERAGKARLVASAEMLRFADEYDLLIVATEGAVERPVDTATRASGYDTWVLAVGDDTADLDGDFDVDSLRRRIAKARKTGGRVRIAWDEDWKETYEITPDLVVELYCDRADGTTSDIERLNGPGVE